MNNSDRIKKKIYDASTTLIQAMRVMDETFTKSIIVFDREHFVGIITNGDLQRAIIANKAFDTPIGKLIDNRLKRYAKLGDNKESLRAWMIEKRAEFMPILDVDGNLVDVIFWDDILSERVIGDNREKIDLPVVIMAGG